MKKYVTFLVGAALLSSPAALAISTDLYRFNPGVGDDWIKEPNVETTGQKVALLVHGAMDNGQNYKKLASFLVKEGYQAVYYFQYRYEHEWTINPETLEFSIIQDIAVDLSKKAFAPLKDQQVHVFAHSLGGLIAMHGIFNFDEGQKIRHLTLLSTPIRGIPTDEVVTFVAENRHEQLKYLLLTQNGQRDATQILAAKTTAEAKKVTFDLLPPIVKQISEGSEFFTCLKQASKSHRAVLKICSVQGTQSYGGPVGTDLPQGMNMITSVAFPQIGIEKHDGLIRRTDQDLEELHEYADDVELHEVDTDHWGTRGNSNHVGFYKILHEIVEQFLNPILKNNTNQVVAEQTVASAESPDVEEPAKKRRKKNQGL